MADGVAKILDVWVPGVPKPKGSMDHIGGGRMKQSVSGSTAWATLVREAVRRKLARGEAVTVRRDVAVSVKLIFRIPGAGPVAERIGDVDKLTRNVLDALTAKPNLDPPYPGAYADDVQVIRFPDVLRVVGRPAGCHIQVFVLSREYVDALTARAELYSWFAYREATDPMFSHAPGAGFGHDCMSEGCGT